MRKILPYFILVLGLFILDQSTKLHAEKALLAYFDPKNENIFRYSVYNIFFIGDKTGSWLDFSLIYTRNTGAAWSLLSGIPPAYRLWFWGGIYAIVLFMVINMLRSTPEHQKLVRTAFFMIIAGALGNFTDRLFLNYVIDWISVSWRIMGWEYYYPAFNIADSSIVVGIGFLLFHSIFLEKKQTPKT